MLFHQCLREYVVMSVNPCCNFSSLSFYHVNGRINPLLLPSLKIGILLQEDFLQKKSAADITGEREVKEEENYAEQSSRFFLLYMLKMILFLIFGDGN